MIWSDFYHFWISGSIICRQLLHSFTDVMKGASPFERTFRGISPLATGSTNKDVDDNNDIFDKGAIRSSGNGNSSKYHYV